MAKNKNNQKPLAGLDDWCSEHWFLTFLIVSSALGIVGGAVSAISNNK